MENIVYERRVSSTGDKVVRVRRRRTSRGRRIVNIIRRVTTIASIVGMLWMAASFIDMNTVNVSAGSKTNQLQSWNMFEIIEQRAINSK